MSMYYDYYEQEAVAKGHLLKLQDHRGPDFIGPQQPDIFAYSGRICNGPACIVCGWSACHHCAEKIPPCPGAEELTQPALAAAPQPSPAPTHECPICEEDVAWSGPDTPYCGECAADNGRDVKMRRIATAPQPAPVSIADALWEEYLRVDEWASSLNTIEEAHAARIAIRCCATRLGVYQEFVALDKEGEYFSPQPTPVDREALVTTVQSTVLINRPAAEAIADALIAAGLRLPTDNGETK